MSRPQKNIDDNITIDGDIHALNLEAAAHTNSYNDLLTHPNLFNSNTIMIKTVTIDAPIGVTDNHGDKADYPSSLDRTVWKNVDVAGYTPLGVSGWKLTGTGWGDVSVYCMRVYGDGVYVPGTEKRKKTSGNSLVAQIINCTGSKKSLTVTANILYRKN